MGGLADGNLRYLCSDAKALHCLPLFPVLIFFNLLLLAPVEDKESVFPRYPHIPEMAFQELRCAIPLAQLPPGHVFTWHTDKTYPSPLSGRNVYVKGKHHERILLTRLDPANSGRYICRVPVKDRKVLVGESNLTVGKIAHNLFLVEWIMKIFNLLSLCHSPISFDLSLELILHNVVVFSFLVLCTILFGQFFYSIPAWGGLIFEIKPLKTNPTDSEQELGRDTMLTLLFFFDMFFRWELCGASQTSRYGCDDCRWRVDQHGALHAMDTCHCWARKPQAHRRGNWHRKEEESLCPDSIWWVCEPECPGDESWQ